MTMNPYLSWAILLVVAGGLGWYYNGPVPKTKTPIKPAVEKTEAALGVKKPKRKPAKKEKSPEPSATQAEEKKQPAVEIKPQEARNVDEDIDNNEMAKRFAAVKSGAVPEGSSKSQKKKKSNKKAAPATKQEQSPSTTGADADDDLSSASSPKVNPTASTAGYVSDMLEEPAPAASVLRVTGSVEQQAKKQKPQSFKQVETKKQRNQRLKNEARKEQVKEAEEERRKLLEKQLHTARESERREAAKSKPATPATNAWQTQNVANGAPKAAPAAAPKVELLDTFDHGASSAKSSGSAPAAGSNKWSQNLPSEDEQMRILGASNGAGDEWTTVSTKAKKPKKGGKADESVSDGSGSEIQATPTAPAPMPAEPKVTVTPTYIPDILRSKQKGHPLDSDWAA